MPMQWVEPAVAFVMDVSGVSIYHVYKDNNWDGSLYYWYTTDILERDEYVFDVRDLPLWRHGGNEEETKRIAIENAMGHGLLNIPEDRKEEER